MSITNITQGQRVEVAFTQGESVERNVWYFQPDGTTPFPELSSYTARMDLRESPDDPTPLATLTSEDGDIALSDTGLIVWEISAAISAALDAQAFGGDLFITAPDADAIHVCGFDFEMTPSYTWEA
ncbi:MAG: hypothetical protein EOM03_17705 [Clostridia bacterium]|nr:hypothetical protein [Clostridia bacterium]